MIPRSGAVFLVGALVLGHGVPAPAHDRPGLDRSLRIEVAQPSPRGALAQSAATPSAGQSGAETPSPSPSSRDPANPLASGVGIVILVTIAGAFLWLRRRALRR